MGKHIEETRLIDLEKSQCEERLMAFEKSKYELKNVVQGELESLIVLQSKIVFSSNGQRITIRVNKKDEQKTEVSIRSELISNLLVSDRGANKKNIANLFGYIEERKAEDHVLEHSKARSPEDLHIKRKLFSWKKDNLNGKMSLMATYLGGHKELEKSLKGSIDIHSDGVDFGVLGPKFTIAFSEIKAVIITSSFDIKLNPAWESSCFKGMIDKDMSDNEKEKKNKLIIDYVNEDELGHCIFRGDSQLEVEKSLLRAQELINGLMKC